MRGVDLSETEALIHQPTRLAIMGLLYRQRDVGFARARDALELTDGNLASHATRLEEAGLLEERRALTEDGFEKRYRITRAGSEAFRSYLGTLKAYLGQHETDAPSPEPEPPGA